MRFILVLAAICGLASGAGAMSVSTLSTGEGRGIEEDFGQPLKRHFASTFATGKPGGSLTAFVSEIFENGGMDPATYNSHLVRWDAKLGNYGDYRDVITIPDRAREAVKAAGGPRGILRRLAAWHADGASPAKGGKAWLQNAFGFSGTGFPLSGGAGSGSQAAASNEDAGEGETPEPVESAATQDSDEGENDDNGGPTEIAAVSLGSALPMLGTGLIAIAVLGWRRRRA